MNPQPLGLQAEETCRGSNPQVSLPNFLEDREGNLWIGTSTGLFRLESKRLRVHSDGLRNDDIQAVTAAPDGTVWVGTAEGVSAIREGKIVNLPPPPGDSGWGRVLTFLTDRKNGLWLCTQSGVLTRFQDGRWEPLPGSR